MKKTFLLIGISLLSFAGFAQKGNNQINVGVELGLPTGDNGDVSKAGFGGTVKGLYGIGTAGQLSLTTGFILSLPKVSLLICLVLIKSPAQLCLSWLATVIISAVSL